MRTAPLVFVLIALACLAGTCSAECTYSGRALQESASVSSHASAAAVYGAVALTQAVSAVAAVPFGMAGSAGAVSAQISEGLMDAATTPVRGPLPISDRIITAGPSPDQALRGKPAPVPGPGQGTK